MQRIITEKKAWLVTDAVCFDTKPTWSDITGNNSEIEKLQRLLKS